MPFLVTAGSLGLTLAVGLTACAVGGAPLVTQTPTVPVTQAPVTLSATPSISPSFSPSAGPSASGTAAVTATPTNPAVKATGRMTLFKNEVSRAFRGTCGRVGGLPTLAIADARNDFFETVDVIVTLSSGGGGVATISAAFGADSEGITRQLRYDQTLRAKGATAVLNAKGTTYTVSGKGMMFEDEAAKGSLIPYRITVTCASSRW